MKSVLVAVMLAIASLAAAQAGPGPAKNAAPAAGFSPARAKAVADLAAAEKARAAEQVTAEAAAKAAAAKAAADKAEDDRARLEIFAAASAIAALLMLVVASVLGAKASERKVERDALQAKLATITAEHASTAAERNALQATFTSTKAERDALATKYAPVISIEQRVAQLQDEAAKLKTDAASETTAVAELRKSRTVLESIVKSLTEDLDVMDHGVYQPHFDFASSEEYKRKMEEVYEQQKAMVKEGTAATCAREWTVSGSKVEGRKMTKQNIKVMLRAFNGEVDAAVANVTWSNIKTMEERVLRAYEAINKNGEANAITINHYYLELAVKELRLAYEYQRKKQDEKEEQRRIKEEMREEERVRQECAKAEKEAQDEALRYEKALARAEEALREAHGEEMAKANAAVEELKASLAEALAKKERAIAQAQLTKTGHIYVISNIGSFGEHVYKIGMTRRLEPMERVHELGDASVPFEFDVHAMIKAEDAPTLEKAFHQKFAERAVNLVNPRKEFFRVDLAEVAAFAKAKGVTVEFTMLAEAREHRESEALRAKPQGPAPARDSTPASRSAVAL